MKRCRKKVKELERQLEFLQIAKDYYKEDRDFYKEEVERLRIAESLLTHEQFGEYCKILNEREKEEAAV